MRRRCLGSELRQSLKLIRPVSVWEPASRNLGDSLARRGRQYRMSHLIITCVGATVVSVANVLAQGVTLDVQGSRPLSLVADELEERYHFAITYEDPSFYAPSQLEDVTTEVQRSPSSARILVPRRKSLRLPNDGLSASGGHASGF
jgi:hypothetical protein